MSIDPKRIVEDEAASPLAAMLRAAHDDVLTQEEVDRIHAALATTTIAARAVTTASGAKTGMLASLPAKLGLAFAVVGVAAGGAWLAQNVATVEAPPAASAHPNPPGLPSDPMPAVTTPPEADMAASPSAAKAAAPHPSRPTPATTTTPAAPQVPTAQPASPPSATPANEGALLLQARRALEDDPARALELVREHERQFPNSQLAPERARIAAEAAKRSAR